MVIFQLTDINVDAARDSRLHLFRLSSDQLKYNKIKVVAKSCSV